MLSLFRVSAVPFRTQLTELAIAGIVPDPGVTDEDWKSFYPLVDYEASPYIKILEALGRDLRREPYTPMCNRLWLCDRKQIKDHGAYRQVIERLQILTRSRLAISGISDFIDIDRGKAWVEFDFEHRRYHWDAKVNGPWMDNDIIVKFDELLRSRVDLVIYSNHAYFGQGALFACISPAEFSIFSKLSRIRFREARKQI